MPSPTYGSSGLSGRKRTSALNCRGISVRVPTGTNEFVAGAEGVLTL
jgi:hypothetical protein